MWLRLKYFNVSAMFCLVTRTGTFVYKNFEMNDVRNGPILIPFFFLEVYVKSSTILLALEET